MKNIFRQDFNKYSQNTHEEFLGSQLNYAPAQMV